MFSRSINPVPALGLINPRSIRIVVVLPAPLARRKPKIAPDRIDVEILLTASFFAKPLREVFQHNERFRHEIPIRITFPLESSKNKYLTLLHFQVAHKDEEIFIFSSRWIHRALLDTPRSVLSDSVSLNLRTSEYIMTFKTKALLTWMGTATPAGPQVALLLGKPENGPLLRDR